MAEFSRSAPVAPWKTRAVGGSPPEWQTRALRALAVSGCALVASMACSPASAAPRSVTVYHQDAVVHDTRNLPLTKGIQKLSLGGLSPQLEGASIRAVTGPRANILQQTYHAPNLTPENLARAAVGGNVQIARIGPQGKETVKRAQLLSVAGDRAVVMVGEKVETVGAGSPWRLIFDGVPGRLSAQPLLSWLIRSDTTGQVPLRMSYITHGLSWRADGNIVIGKSGDTAHLGIWAVVDNHCGLDFQDVNVKLVAGNLHRAGPRPIPRSAALQAKFASAAAPERTLGDYHLYSVPFKVTLSDDETTQLRLAERSSVPIAIRHRVRIDTAAVQQTGGRQTVPVHSVLEIDNTAPALGIPLPAGLYRVYRTTASGAAEFVGEANVSYTAPTSTFRLPMGQAGDIVAEARETQRRAINDGYEAAWRIDVRNTRKVTEAVLVTAGIPPQADVLATSEQPETPQAGMLRWKLTVKPGQRARVVFRYRVRTPKR